MAKTYLIPEGTEVEVVSGSITLVVTDCDASTMTASTMSGGGECRGGCRGIGGNLNNIEGLPCADEIFSMCFVPKLDADSSFTTTMAATCLITSAIKGECATVRLTHGTHAPDGVELRIPRGEDGETLEDPYCDAGSE